MHKELQNRLRTAGFLIGGFALLLFASSLASPLRWLLLLLGCAAGVRAAYEVAALLSRGFEDRAKGIVYFCAYAFPVIFSLLAFAPADFNSEAQLHLLSVTVPVFVFLLSMFVLFVYGLSSNQESLASFRYGLAEMFPGLFLCSLGAPSLIVISAMQGSWQILLWLVLVVAVNDSAAYFVGRYVGGRSLTSLLSPGKTLSGHVGGLVGGLLVGLLAGRLLPYGTCWVYVFLLVVLVVIFAQSGDLLKSYLKREHGAEDFGSLFPGHGGVVDRLDGILLSAPVLLYFNALVAAYL